METFQSSNNATKPQFAQLSWAPPPNASAEISPAQAALSSTFFAILMILILLLARKQLAWWQIHSIRKLLNEAANLGREKKKNINSTSWEQPEIICSGETDGEEQHLVSSCIQTASPVREASDSTPI